MQSCRPLGNHQLHIPSSSHRRTAATLATSAWQDAHSYQTSVTATSLQEKGRDIMLSTKIMLLGVLLLLLGLGIITTMIPQAAGSPLSFLFRGLSSTTQRIINYVGYTLILLGLIVGLVGFFLKQ